MGHFFLRYTTGPGYVKSSLRRYESENGEVAILADGSVAPATPTVPGETAIKNTRRQNAPGPASSETARWMTFADLGEWGQIEPTKGATMSPACFKDPQGQEHSVSSWSDLFYGIARWLVEAELLTEPFTFSAMTKRRLIHSEPIHPDGRKFGFNRQLPNGLFLECKWAAKAIARLSGRLLAAFDQDPRRFQVQLY